MSFSQKSERGILYNLWLFFLIFIFGGLCAFFEICFSGLFSHTISFFEKSLSNLDFSVLVNFFYSRTFRLNLLLFWVFSGIAVLYLLPFFIWTKTGKYLRSSSLTTCLGVFIILLFATLIYSVHLFKGFFVSVRIFVGLSITFFLIVWLAGLWLVSKFTRFKFLDARLIFFSGLGFFRVLVLVRSYALLKFSTSFSSLALFSLSAFAGIIIGFLLGITFCWLAERVGGWKRFEMCLTFILFFLGLYNLSLPMREWLRVYYPQKPRKSRLIPVPVSSPQQRFDLDNKNLPSVLLIVMDTVRADHLSLYGYKRQTTPFLDWLGARSVVFERAYSASPWTMPSHASIFTGLLPGEHNCNYENLYLNSKLSTLAEVLWNQGYITLGYTNNQSINRPSGLTQGFERFYLHTSLGFFSGEIFHWLRFLVFNIDMLSDSGARLTNITLKKWLRRLKGRERPFFIFLNYMEAHIPYPEVFRAYKFFPEGTLPKNYNPYNLDWNKYICQSEVAPELREISIDHYDGAIYYLDFMLSQVYEMLDRFGYLDNTIIIIVGDHGEMFGEHNNFWGHNYYLYEPLIRVPFLIYYPRLLKPVRVQAPISLIEIPRIVEDLIQGRAPQQIFRPREEPLLAEVYKPYLWVDVWQNSGCSKERIHQFMKEQKAVLLWPYKLIWDEGGEDLLFDLSRDPQEKVNLKNQKLGIFTRLSSTVDLYRARQVIREKKEKPIVDVTTLNALRALGYIR